MTQPRFWKNLPTPLRLLLRPWVIASLGLHILFLIMPLPERSTSELPLSEQPVRITQLPSSPAPPPTTTPGTPVPPPPTAQTPSAIPSRTDAPPPVSPTPQPQESPRPTPTPDPSPVPQTASNDPSSSNPSSPDPTLDPPTPDPSLRSEANSLAEDFPHTAVGGEPGCSGQENCWQTQDTQWRSVARGLERELTNRGYDVESRTDEETLNYRVYEVSKDGEVKYLNLLSTLQGTVYVLADQPLTREELEQLTETPSS